MPELNVQQGASPAFTQITEQFQSRWYQSDTHIRLRDGTEGRVLHSNSSKLSFTGNGLRTDREGVMTQRNRGSEMVVNAFKAHYSDHPKLVDKIMKHVMSDPSFEKTGEGANARLQLRVSDVGRLQAMMETEIRSTNLLNEASESIFQDYSTEVRKAVLSKVFGMDGMDKNAGSRLLGEVNMDEMRPRLEQALAQHISDQSVHAQLDGNSVTRMFSGDVGTFKTAITANSDAIMTPHVSQALGSSGSLQGVTGLTLSLHHLDRWLSGAGHGNVQDFERALHFGTGLRPSSEPPEPPPPAPKNPDRPERGAFEPLGSERIHHQALQRDWGSDQIRRMYLGEPNRIGLSPDAMRALNTELNIAEMAIGSARENYEEELGRLPPETRARIDTLKSEIAKGSTRDTPEARESRRVREEELTRLEAPLKEAAKAVDDAVKTKVKIINEALNGQATAMVQSHAGNLNNPIARALEGQTTDESMTRAIDEGIGTGAFGPEIGTILTNINNSDLSDSAKLTAKKAVLAGEPTTMEAFRTSLGQGLDRISVNPTFGASRMNPTDESKARFLALRDQFLTDLRSGVNESGGMENARARMEARLQNMDQSELYNIARFTHDVARSSGIPDDLKPLLTEMHNTAMGLHVGDRAWTWHGLEVEPA